MLQSTLLPSFTQKAPQSGLPTVVDITDFFLVPSTYLATNWGRVKKLNDAIGSALPPYPSPLPSKSGTVESRSSRHLSSGANRIEVEELDSGKIESARRSDQRMQWPMTLNGDNPTPFSRLCLSSHCSFPIQPNYAGTMMGALSAA